MKDHCTCLHLLQHRDRQRSCPLGLIQSQAETAAKPSAFINTYFQTELHQAQRALKFALEKRYAHPFHRDFRASGLREEVKQAHERLYQMAQKAGGKPPEPFDETAWLRTAKRAAIRSKPYILQEAAQQCKNLAIKAGWLEVQLQEIKKVVA